jgi:hypothetical protein
MYVLRLVFHNDCLYGANISFTRISDEFESTFHIIGHFPVLCLFRFFYEVKPISRDPGISRELTHKFPLSREIDFPGKWECLFAMLLHMQ